MTYRALGLIVAAGCSVDVHSVDVDSSEVREGRMAIQLDDTEDPVLRLWFSFASDGASCARLDDTARVVMERGDEQVELEVTSRGDGSKTLDCALKCHDLVALETQCAPLQAELRGAAVERLFASQQLRVALDDDRASLGMTIASDGMERRSPSFPEGSVAAVDSDTPSYSFTSLPFRWSHADRAHWVNQWPDNFRGSRDGNFSAFNLDFSDPDALAVSVRNDAPRGVNQVFFAATTDSLACDFQLCDGLEHVTSAPIRVVERD
jgi:hypothetical protein